MPRVEGFHLLTAMLAVLALGPATARATDVDGPGDCSRVVTDYGDAPEGIPAYPGGILGRFPSCASGVALGAIDGTCAPNFFLPPAGSIVGWESHVNFWPGIPNFWLGCNPLGGDSGIDTEYQAKVNTPASGSSFCGSQTTDCVETAFGGMTFGQDECFGDNSDAGLIAVPVLNACQLSTLTFSTWNCGPSQPAYLNVLLDLNQDGDWMDAFECTIGGQTVCAHEWAIVNTQITLNSGCETHVSPPFAVGPNAGHSWLRISISYDPAPTNYPWGGSVWIGGPHFPPYSQFTNGETEDYPVEIGASTPARRSSWGDLKQRYR